jgi:hypothetical protein
VREAFAESDNYFPTQLQKFQFYDKYSRFNYELGRRETWIETVNRAVDFSKSCPSTACRPTPTPAFATVFGDEGHALHAPVGDGRPGGAAQQHRHLQLLLHARRQRRFLCRSAHHLHERLRRGLFGGAAVRGAVSAHHAAKGQTLPQPLFADSSEGWAEAVRRG